MSGPDLDPELTALEAALRALEPQPTLPRDRVLFESGRAAAQRSWLWPSSTAVSTAAALLLGWLLWRQPEALPPGAPETRIIVVERVVPAPAPVEEPPPPAPSVEQSVPPVQLAELLRRHRDAVRWGIDALPASRTHQTAGETLTPGSLQSLSARALADF